MSVGYILKFFKNSSKIISFFWPHTYPCTDEVKFSMEDCSTLNFTPIIEVCHPCRTKNLKIAPTNLNAVACADRIAASN